MELVTTNFDYTVTVSLNTSGPVSNDPAFQQLANGAWQAMKEWQDNPCNATLQAFKAAKAALTAYLTANPPAATDEPAYTISNDIDLGTLKLSDLALVPSCYKDQSNTAFKSAAEQLQGDIKEYDWEMSLPAGQRDPDVINSLLTKIAKNIGAIKGMTGITDGFLTVLMSELSAPLTPGGPSLESLADAVNASTPPKQSDLDALNKELQSIGETGTNGGLLRYIISQANYQEYSDSL